MLDQKLLDSIRKSTPDESAKELISVQPIPNDSIQQLYENSIDESELVKQGFKPIDNQSKLVWVKKEHE